MKKNLATLLVLVLTSFSAGAVSMRTCSPTVDLEASRLTCFVDGRTYSIKIQTAVSIPECTAEQRQTYSVADILITNKSGQKIGSLSIGDGDFSFELDGMGGGWFSSSKPQMDLDSCISPLHGAVSFGN